MAHQREQHYFDIPYRPSTIVDIINESARRYGHHPAVSYFEGNAKHVIDFKQYKSDIAFVTQLIQQKTSGESLHIALMGVPSYCWMLCFFAIIADHDIVVPLDDSLDTQSLDYIINQSNADIVICDQAFTSTITSFWSGTLLTTEEIMHAVNHNPNDLSDTDFLSINQPDPQDLVMIMYTSGTSGRPKGVTTSHENLVSEVIMGQMLMKGVIDGGNISLLPFYHAYSILTAIIYPLYVGCCAYISRGLRYVAEDLKAYQPVTILAVPLIADSFYKTIKSKLTGCTAIAARLLIVLRKGLLKIGCDPRKVFFKQVFTTFGPNFDYIICGGARLNPETEQGLENFGVTILNGYGMTECFPSVSTNTKEIRKRGSVGRVEPFVNVRIDPTTQEILVRGPMVSPGYYRDDERNRERFIDGWFKTGDRGHLDDDGFLFFDGRLIDNIVLSNGENVDPAEIENLFRLTQGLQDMLVFLDTSAGVDHLSALISLDPETPDVSHAKATISHAVDAYNAHVALHRRLKHVTFTAKPFIYTASRKLKRADTMRALYSSSTANSQS